MEDQEKKFIKLFNLGYQLNQHDPELLKEMMSSKSHEEYSAAIKLGAKEFEKEKIAKQMKESQERNKQNNKMR